MILIWFDEWELAKVIYDFRILLPRYCISMKGNLKVIFYSHGYNIFSINVHWEKVTFIPSNKVPLFLTSNFSMMKCYSIPGKRNTVFLITVALICLCFQLLVTFSTIYGCSCSNFGGKDSERSPILMRTLGNTLHQPHRKEFVSFPHTCLPSCFSPSIFAHTI